MDPNMEDAQMEISGNRLTSFFVYLVADCLGGTTAFPKVPRPHGQEWCDSLVCNDEIEHVEVIAKAGTAIFWYDMDPWYNVDELTLHAGMPVLNGTKTGLNIWTREKLYRDATRYEA
jgi:prolyl 4-hydroxylase